ESGLSKHVQRHAVDWYRKAMPTLTGLAKTKTLGRMAKRYGTSPLPAAPNGLSAKAVDCAKGVPEFQVGDDFDLGKSWVLFAEVQIPAFEPDVHIIFLLGDDRIGMDPISMMLANNKLFGTVDDCRTNTRQGVAVELGPERLKTWTKV